MLRAVHDGALRRIAIAFVAALSALCAIVALGL
jgi:hypothetical protein